MCSLLERILEMGMTLNTSQMAGFGKYEFEMIKPKDFVCVLFGHLNVY